MRAPSRAHRLLLFGICICTPPCATLPRTALHRPSATFSRRAALVGLPFTLPAVALALPKTSIRQAILGFDDSEQPDAGLEDVSGNGFMLRIPASYYKQRGGVKDVLYVAGDYVAGRTVSVSRTPAYDLLADSGDPLPFETGSPRSLLELGKPAYLASLMSLRRDGDPQGLQTPISKVVDAVRDENELRFQLVTQTSAEVSMTQARPAARVVQVRSIFVPSDPRARGPYFLTVWVSSPAKVLTNCETPVCSCGEGSSLSCECPPTTCQAEGSGEPDAASLSAIIDSLSVT